MTIQRLLIYITCIFLCGCSLPSEQIESYKQKVLEQKKALAKARKARIQKEFELHLIEALLTVRTRELEYSLQPSPKTRSNFFNSIQSLEKSYQTLITCSRDDSNAVLEQHLKVFHKNFKEYCNSFEALSKAQEKLGFTRKSGARGALRNGSHELMACISKNRKIEENYRLRYQILEIRRAEKDYLLRKDSTFLEKARKGVKTFSQLLSEVDPSLLTACTKAIASYRSALNTYELSESDLTEKKGLLKEQYEELKLSLSQLKEVLNKETQN